MSGVAPIALFVYKRPAHTRTTLEALSKNPGARDSTLYVFADGPQPNASEHDLDAIDEVRKIVRERPWCGRVEVIESSINQGLAASIVNGVSHVVAEHGSVIVLEDDLEVSTGFLRYMNDALEMYREDSRVFQISGYMVPRWGFRPRTGMLRVSTSWGWATWERAWRHYSNDAEELLSRVEAIGRRAFDLDGYSFHFDELERNVSGELNTWAVRWYASIFVRGGLCVYPYRSLVKNLGFDGSGTHCHDDTTGSMQSGRLPESVRVKWIEVYEDPRYLKAMQAHYQNLHRLWTHTRLRDRAFAKATRLKRILLRTD